MATAKIKYLGDLKCEMEHVQSGAKIVTAAPIDNKGDGSSFSPTDLLASAYVSCMVTIIGIYCNSNGLEFNKCEAEVTKIMASGPRRISELVIDIDLSGNNWTSDQQIAIIKAAEACPVAKSVSEEMLVTINYMF
jgi:putative redox protein